MCCEAPLRLCVQQFIGTEFELDGRELEKVHVSKAEKNVFFFAQKMVI